MTDMLPKPNVELLDRTLAEVRRAARRKRLRWDQDSYREHDECGTAMCFAGWAITLDGGVWADEKNPDVPTYYVLPRPGEPATRDWGGTLVVDAFASAQRRLGLTNGEAVRLFLHSYTLGDISRIVRQIKQRA